MFQQKLHFIILYHPVKREDNLFTQQELDPLHISLPTSNIGRVSKNVFPGLKEKGKQANDLFKSTDKGDKHQAVKNQRAKRLQG